MDVLVLGGTRFVGRAIVEALLQHHHGVTLFNRGRDRSVFPEATRITGDRDSAADVARIGGRTWEAVIDVSGYRPAQVRAVLDALGEPTRYVYVSTVSVYAQPLPPGADEAAPLLDVDESIASGDPRSYGGLKVLAERELHARLGGLMTVLRPTVVTGPDDYTDRFSWWVRRVAAGGRIEAPPRLEQPVQLIDVDDLAAFTVRCLEQRILGTFNAVGPREPLTMGGMIDAIATAAGVHVSVERIDGTRAERLPLVVDDPAHDGAFQVSGQAAYQHGLTLTPLVSTARAVLTRQRDPSG